jgi:hypothetical protein
LLQHDSYQFTSVFVILDIKHTGGRLEGHIGRDFGVETYRWSRDHQGMLDQKESQASIKFSSSVGKVMPTQGDPACLLHPNLSLLSNTVSTLADSLCGASGDR